VDDAGLVQEVEAARDVQRDAAAAARPQQLASLRWVVQQLPQVAAGAVPSSR